jgi:L-asparaginase
MSLKAKILLLYTGGTIGMSKDFETGALKAFNFNKLLQRIPELKQLDNRFFEYESCRMG